jgi:hypothetical protein
MRVQPADGAISIGVRWVAHSSHPPAWLDAYQTTPRRGILLHWAQITRRGIWSCLPPKPAHFGRRGRQRLRAYLGVDPLRAVRIVVQRLHHGSRSISQGGRTTKIVVSTVSLTPEASSLQCRLRSSLSLLV